VDSRYIYASVMEDELYRSDDWGCTWHKLSTPLRSRCQGSVDVR
jgi:hypothetical protein